MKKVSFWNNIGKASRNFIATFGYDAAKNTRHRANRGNEPIRSEELELQQYDRDRIVSACLNLRRNNPVVASISRLRKGDVVGRGIMPQPRTGNTELDKLLEDDWLRFCEQPEITGMMDMRELQQQLADSLLYYGDSGLIFTNDEQGRMQFIDGTRIGNPSGAITGSEDSEWQAGVKVNGIGAPVAYGIGRRINGTLKDIRSIPARNFAQFMRRVRPTQYRGIPELASVLNTLQDCDEYDRIEIIAAKVAASLSVAVKRENAYEFELANREPMQDQDEVGGLERFEPGRFHYMEPGEDISVISSSNRPNVDGIAFVSYMLRKVGSAVGIPLEFLLMEIGGSSFSASQAVILQYQQTVETYQNDLIKIMNRIYRRRIDWHIANNRISPIDAPSIYAVRWQRPQFRWVNKAAQVKADLEYYRLGAMSIDDVVAPFGYTADEVLERKAQNIERAKEIAQRHGIENWQQLINPYSTHMTADMTPQLADEEIDNGDNGNDG